MVEDEYRLVPTPPLQFTVKCSTIYQIMHYCYYTPILWMKMLIPFRLLHLASNELADKWCGDSTILDCQWNNTYP